MGNNKINQEKDIKRLQKNIAVIRKMLGWTAQDLADKIGVTKATISNIENFKTNMTLTQYLATRAILEFESQTNPQMHDILKIIFENLLNNSDLDEEEEEVLTKVVTRSAVLAKDGMKGDDLNEVSDMLAKKEGSSLSFEVDKYNTGVVSDIEKAGKKVGKVTKKIVTDPKNMATGIVSGMLFGPFGLGAWIGKNLYEDDDFDDYY